MVCFFLSAQTPLRAAVSLPEAACAYAARSGARVAEAYPWPGGASYRYVGTRGLYLAAGSTVPGGYRPVMRRTEPSSVSLRTSAAVAGRSDTPVMMIRAR